MLKTVYESMNDASRARVKNALVRIVEGAAELLELALKLAHEEAGRKKENVH